MGVRARACASGAGKAAAALPPSVSQNAVSAKDLKNQFTCVRARSRAGKLPDVDRYVFRGGPVSAQPRRPQDIVYWVFPCSVSLRADFSSRLPPDRADWFSICKQYSTAVCTKACQAGAPSKGGTRRGADEKIFLFGGLKCLRPVPICVFSGGLFARFDSISYCRPRLAALSFNFLEWKQKCRSVRYTTA